MPYFPLLLLFAQQQRLKLGPKNWNWKPSPSNKAQGEVGPRSVLTRPFRRYFRLTITDRNCPSLQEPRYLLWRSRTGIFFFFDFFAWQPSCYETPSPFPFHRAVRGRPRGYISFAMPFLCRSGRETTLVATTGPFQAPVRIFCCAESENCCVLAHHRQYLILDPSPSPQPAP